MSVTLVTGATGFIGAHVVRALVQRGDRVRALRRAASAVPELADLPSVEWVEADILDRRALRRAIGKDTTRVFHLAGTTSLRMRADDVFRLNVGGTRMLLEECLRSDAVERVVHTSSVVAVGPSAPNTTADETQVFTAGRLGIPYVNSKREAEAEALKACAQGLPVVIVNPAHTLGAGDRGRSSTDVVRRVMLGRLPAYVDGAINVVDVRDVAQGHLLADEKGRAGERYILGNRNYTWERLFADISRLTGVEPPPVKLPVAVAEAMVGSLSRMPFSPVATPVEVRAAGQWWTYRNTKARRELGFSTGAHEDTVEQTVQWIRDREGARLASASRRQPVGLKLLGFAGRQLEDALGRVLPR